MLLALTVARGNCPFAQATQMTTTGETKSEISSPDQNKKLLDAFFRNCSTREGNQQVFLDNSKPAFSVCLYALLVKPGIDKEGWHRVEYDESAKRDIELGAYAIIDKLILQAFGPDYKGKSVDGRQHISDDELAKLITAILALPAGTWAIPTKPEKLQRKEWSQTRHWL
jgi:hypothetical protein